MPLFTFILDYRGGTYIAQVKAPTFRHAPKRWAASLQPGDVQHMGAASLAELLEQAEDQSSAVELEGLNGAWCFSALVRGKLALVNFVETARPTV